MMNFKSHVPGREASQTLATSDDFSDQLMAFRRQMDRMFEDLLNHFGGRPLRRLGGGWRDVTPTEATGTDKDVVVTAELPGLGEKDFEVTLSGDILTITAIKRPSTSRRTGVTITRTCAKAGGGALG
jgi:HSP20 family protein